MKVRLFACTGVVPGATNVSPFPGCRLKLRAMKHQLDFEKPITELQNTLEELKKHPEKQALGISFDEQVALIEKKLAETRRQIYSNLQRLGSHQDCPPPQAALHAGLPGVHV